jgi:hypothetical protein
VSKIIFNGNVLLKVTVTMMKLLVYSKGISSWRMPWGIKKPHWALAGVQKHPKSNSNNPLMQFFIT